MDTNLRDVLRAWLTEGQCCALIDHCIDVEAARSHATGMLVGPYETRVEFTPNDKGAWNFVWTEYVSHVSSCCNRRHFIPVFGYARRTTESQGDAHHEFTVRLATQNEIEKHAGKPDWQPFGSGLLVKRKG